jgi:hypothetical protein
VRGHFLLPEFLQVAYGSHLFQLGRVGQGIYGSFNKSMKQLGTPVKLKTKE